MLHAHSTLLILGVWRSNVANVSKPCPISGDATLRILSTRTDQDFVAPPQDGDPRHCPTGVGKILTLKKKLGALGRLTDIDLSVALALSLRFWQAAAGAVTLLLIARYFSPELQGYYYAFGSLLALQVYVELGLYIVILFLASHEWSRLQLSPTREVVGDPSALARLASLIKFTARWYFAASLLFVVGVGIAGHVFFSNAHDFGQSWQGPWWAVVAFAAIQLWLMPLLCILEGCNQVVELNRFRLAQTIAEAAVVWLFLVFGGGLWVAVASISTKVLSSVLFLTYRYRTFIASVLRGAGTEVIDWKLEVWPMQWRLAAQATTNYLVFSMFTPVMFHFQGPKLAGQMGMTLQIIGVIQMMASAWLQARSPRFGMLAAQRNFGELDVLWGRAFRWSMTFIIAASLAFLFGLILLRTFDVPLAERVLSPMPVALFLLAYTFMQVSGCWATYLRAHAKEPFLLVGVTGGILNGLLLLIFGSRYGAEGAATGFLITAAVFIVPASYVILKRRRAEWQADTTLAT